MSDPVFLGLSFLFGASLSFPNAAKVDDIGHRKGASRDKGLLVEPGCRCGRPFVLETPLCAEPRGGAR